MRRLYAHSRCPKTFFATVSLLYPRQSALYPLRDTILAFTSGRRVFALGLIYFLIVNGIS